MDLKTLTAGHLTKLTGAASLVTVKFRKLAPQCISPSKYKPARLVTQKNPPLNRPSKYKLPGRSKNGKFPFNYKLAQSMLKRKFPSVAKPLQKKKAPQKGPLKNVSSRAYFRNFRVVLFVVPS